MLLLITIKKKIPIQLHLKYFPVTFSKLSSTAQFMLVCAPSQGVLNPTRLRKGDRRENPGKYLPNSVATPPGCTEFTVTPVPEASQTNKFIFKVDEL